jgi:sugar/nucleoside kinase (ribokinase family)
VLPVTARAVDVVGFGASSVDYVTVVPTAPSTRGPEAKQRISAHFVSCGGQVATMLAACAAFGLRTRYLGPLGNDANARLVRAELERRRVDVSAAIVRPADNQFAVIIVDEQSGERIVLWSRDARLALEGVELDAAALTAGRVLHVDDVDEEASIRAARIAAAAGVMVTSDIDRVTGRTADLIASVTVPILDEHVPEALTGRTDPVEALRALRQPHHRLLCVTLGRRGAVALEGDRVVHAAALDVHAADTTAAGDIFRAGLVTALLGDRPLDDALRFANAAAGLGCTRRGAMASIPSHREVELATEGP